MNRNREYEEFKNEIVAEAETSIEDLIDQADDSTIFRILDDHGVPKQDGDPREILKNFYQAGEIQSWEVMDGLNLGPGTSMMNEYSTHQTWGSKKIADINEGGPYWVYDRYNIVDSDLPHIPYAGLNNITLPQEWKDQHPQYEPLAGPFDSEWDASDWMEG